MAEITTSERPPEPSRRVDGFWRHYDDFLMPASLVILLLCWEAAVRLFDVPSYIVPTPSDATVALFRIFSGGLFWENFGVTLLETLVGFFVAFVAALMVAILIAESRIAEKIIYPYLAALQSMPKIALAPLVVLWFGFGLESKMVLSALLCFFPMVVNFISGLRAADVLQLRLLRVLYANVWQVVWLVRLPSALPFILVGIELGAIYAMLGAIVAEFIGAKSGIGYWLMQMNAIMDTAGSFALLFILAAYGILIQWALGFARRKLLFWTGSGRSGEGR
jgi:NitT/TauT family transport system permease protein